MNNISIPKKIFKILLEYEDQNNFYFILPDEIKSLIEGKEFNYVIASVHESDDQVI